MKISGPAVKTIRGFMARSNLPFTTRDNNQAETKIDWDQGAVGILVKESLVDKDGFSVDTLAFIVGCNSKTIIFADFLRENYTKLGWDVEYDLEGTLEDVFFKKEESKIYEEPKGRAVKV